MQATASEPKSDTVSDFDPAPALFALGPVEVSPRAARTLLAAGVDLDDLLAAHATGDDGGGLEDDEEEVNAQTLAEGRGSFLGSHDVGEREVMIHTRFDADGSDTRVCLADEAGEFLVTPADRRAAWVKDKELRDRGRKSPPPPASFEEEFVRIDSRDGHHPTLANGHPANRVQGLIPDRPAPVPAPPPAPTRPITVTAETITPADRERLRELYRVQPESTPAQVAAQFEAVTSKRIHPLTVRSLCSDLPMPPGKPRSEAELAANDARKKAASTGARRGPKPGWKAARQGIPKTPPVGNVSGPSPAAAGPGTPPIDALSAVEQIIDVLSALSVTERHRAMLLVGKFVNPAA